MKRFLDWLFVQYQLAIFKLCWHGYSYDDSLIDKIMGMVFKIRWHLYLGRLEKRKITWCPLNHPIYPIEDLGVKK